MPTSVSVLHVSKIFDASEQPRPSWLGEILPRRGASQEAQHEREEPSRQQALDDVSFTVRPAETLALLGPSGCGKTTLLRIIAGILAPTSGDILYDGERVNDIPPSERGVGMVFQNYALYPHLPGVDNVGMFLRLHRRAEEIPERVREISQAMHIDLRPLLGRMPPTMSGGEKQRVAIARCLARDPRIFLFDEPFANLDAKFRSDTRVELKRLLARYEVTSLYVTHDQQEAVALADRIAIMRRGHIEQIGTFRHLYDTPANAFVAGFFGNPTMNLFNGRVRDGYWHGREFSWGPIRPGISAGAALVLGIRAEHLQLNNEGVIRVTVQQIEPHFSERKQIIYGLLGQQRITVQLPFEHKISLGDALRFSLDADHVHLFDGKTGQRIG